MPFATTKPYIAGQELAYTIYFPNGFSITTTSADSELASFSEYVQVVVTAVGYRDLKLDAMLSDRTKIVLTIAEWLAVVNVVSKLAEHQDLYRVELDLRKMLNRTV